MITMFRYTYLLFTTMVTLCFGCEVLANGVNVIKGAQYNANTAGVTTNVQCNLNQTQQAKTYFAILVREKAYLQ